MKRFDNIQSIMEFMLRKHPGVRQGSTGGFIGYKMLRKLDGTRILFESVDGFRIYDYLPFDNGVRINSMATGFEFRGTRKIQQQSMLYLTDLVVINVYDYCADFFSTNSIDFTYIEKTKEAEINLLSEFIRKDPGVMRAQWLSKDEDLERSLDMLSIGMKVKQVAPSKRFIDMDTDF